MSHPEVAGHLELTRILDGHLHARILPIEGKGPRILGKHYYASAMTDDEDGWWWIMGLSLVDTGPQRFGPIQTLDEIPIWSACCLPHAVFENKDLERMLWEFKQRVKRFWWPPVWFGEWA